MAYLLSPDIIIFKMNYPYELSLTRKFTTYSEFNFIIHKIYQICCNWGKGKIRFSGRKKCDKIKRQNEDEKRTSCFFFNRRLTDESKEDNSNQNFFFYSGPTVLP